MLGEPYVEGRRFVIHVSKDGTRADVNDKKDRKAFTLLTKEEIEELMGFLQDTFWTMSNPE